MSGLLITVLVILGAFGLYGYMRGFVRVVFSIVAIFLVIGLVSLMTPYTAAFLKEQTPLYNSVREKCIESIQLKAQEEMQQNAEQQEQINGIELPQQWQEFFSDKAIGAADGFMENNGVYEQMGDYAAGIIVKGIAFLITLIIVALVLGLLVNLLDIIAKLPVLDSMNHIGGLAAGLVQGLLVVWILFVIITVCQTTSFGQEMMESINGNIFLKLLYEYNGIEYVVMRVLTGQ